MGKPKHVTLAAPISAIDHRVGAEHARVLLLEYGDFECPICHAVEPAVKQLRAAHRTDLLFIFRHYPLEVAHPHALVAAEAAEAAAAQGQFWPMHDLLLTDPNRLTRQHLQSYAEQLGLDMPRFNAEMDDEIYRQRVREHQDGGRRSHLRATPGFYVNGVIQDISGGMRALFDAVTAELQ
ncbi:MAG TPA: thioredoxin domain-containing protein [Steroidobacteraceae bacterium]